MNSQILDSDILLPIYNDYLKTFKNCEKESDPYLNLMGLIFHEAIYITSAFIYQKYWLKREEINIDYPFLGYRDHKVNSVNKFNYTTFKKEIASYYSSFY